MNIECAKETLDELDHTFRFNDAILRHLIVKMSGSVTTPSPMMREEKARPVTARADEEKKTAQAEEAAG